MTLAWKFVARALEHARIMWFAHRPYTLHHREYSTAMPPVDPSAADALPVFAFIAAETTVHCQFHCLCGEQIALHRSGESKSTTVTYFETCRECKRRWSLVLAPTLPTFGMTLAVVKP